MKHIHAPGGWLLAAWLAAAAACGHAEPAGIHASASPQQRLIIENLNLSGARFFQAYMSQDDSQRRLAEMYLAGVLDAGEGKRWCGYRTALPGSLQEVIHLGLRKQSAASMQRRASEVIEEVLRARLPCKAAP